MRQEMKRPITPVDAGVGRVLSAQLSFILLEDD